MSMISGLIDELNKSADEWNGSNMFELARMCREAADTIWQLRDDLQRANAENALLRSELDSVGTAAYLYGRSDLKAENTKLRELAKELLEGYMDPQCEDCPMKHKPACVDCPICAREAAVIDRMREMGVEVE
jgi:hypothetical protein